jgi:hypothetical protein
MTNQLIDRVLMLVRKREKIWLAATAENKSVFPNKVTIFSSKGFNII